MIRQAHTRHQTLLLTQRDVAALVDVRVAIRVVREAFKAMARGEATMPSKVYLTLPHDSDFRAMPAYLQHPAACGMKWVNVHPHNPAHGLPTVMAMILLNDPVTGIPLAVMDGLLITKLRTAAAAAVAADVLARRDSRTVGLIGCGAQADAQLLALAAVRRISHVKVWGFRRGEAARFAQRMRRQMPRVVFEPVTSIERCVRGVDILVTITPSHRPLVKRAWVAPGTHINAIGADAPGKQELDPKILQAATVVVDEIEQALHGGEINVAISRGQFHRRDIHATLGKILIGRSRGRRTRQEITIFDSTGLAIHDIALAAEVFRRAVQRGMGKRLKFFSR
ncbi:MAG: ornithine cyclodeaminase family protein [Candidatus Omnitrophica bacterium]|nr:ornithine cyclodeaminase family protein [Candidatus Omnitrophota bacterium]